MRKSTPQIEQEPKRTWDVVPAWWDQLAIWGRIVVPLRLHGSGLTRAISFDLHQPDRMVSTTAVVCGFVPMRGAAEHAEQHVRLADDVVLKVDADDRPDHPVLTQSLTHPGQQQWTGIPVRHDEPAEHLDLWLLTTTASRFGRLSVSPDARANGVADPGVAGWVVCRSGTGQFRGMGDFADVVGGRAEQYGHQAPGPGDGVRAPR